MSGLTGQETRWACEWVRPGAPGVTRYEGTQQVFAPNREVAIERARIEVARRGCFARFEINVTSAVQS